MTITKEMDEKQILRNRNSIGMKKWIPTDSSSLVFINNEDTIFEIKTKGSTVELWGHNRFIPTFHLSGHDSVAAAKAYVASHFAIR